MAYLNSIIDLSHHEQQVDMAALQAGGIAAVLHKATQGLNFLDPYYATRTQEAKAAGLLWGAYHFGVGGDGVDQAEYFLNAVAPYDSTLLVLDLEANLAGPSMTLDEARAFVTHVQAVTGAWPGLYSGHYLKGLLQSAPDPVLSNCWLWVAQYGPTAVIPPAWSNWTLWQYTDGAVGNPPLVPGVGRCDRNRFDGTLDDLTAFWNSPAGW